MILRRVGRFLDRHGLTSAGDLVLAGVSGGPDSMFLLTALHRILPARGCALHVAHLNHCLRGEESDADAAFVAEACRVLGIPCTVERRPVPGGREASPQVRARRVRLAFLEEVCRSRGASSIALGHTADDQAETVLLRLLTGGGPGALAGIRPRGPGGIIHPLLDIERREILAFLESHGVPWRSDSSNDGIRYLRNRLRHAVMPLVREINPSFPRRAAEIGRLLGDDDRFLARRAAAILRRHISSRDGSLSLPTGALSPLPQPLLRRVLLRAARRAGAPVQSLGIRHVERLLDLLGGHAGRSVSLPGGVAATRSTAALTFGPPPGAAAGPFERPVAVPGRTPVPEAGVALETEEVLPPAPEELAAGPDVAFIDAGALAGPLSVRSRRPGDWLVPLGLGHHRKLQDVLTDRKVPRAERDRLPLVCDSEKIVWVPGLGPDHRVRITSATRRAIRLRAVAAGEVPT